MWKGLNCWLKNNQDHLSRVVISTEPSWNSSREILWSPKALGSWIRRKNVWYFTEVCLEAELWTSDWAERKHDRTSLAVQLQIKQINNICKTVIKSTKTKKHCSCKDSENKTKTWFSFYIPWTSCLDFKVNSCCLRKIFDISIFWCVDSL